MAAFDAHWFFNASAAMGAQDVQSLSWNLRTLERECLRRRTPRPSSSNGGCVWTAFGETWLVEKFIVPTLQRLRDDERLRGPLFSLSFPVGKGDTDQVPFSDLASLDSRMRRLRMQCVPFI